MFEKEAPDLQRDGSVTRSKKKGRPKGRKRRTRVLGGMPEIAQLPKEAALRINVRIGTLVAAASMLAIAAPAGAHPGNSSHPDPSNHLSGSNHATQSHRCTPHSVAYIESGTIDSSTASTLAANPDGTWSGALVVDVTRTNHWAKSDKGTTVTYTFTNAGLTVRLDSVLAGIAAGERVKLIGRLTVVARNCAAPTPEPTPVFRAVVVHPADS
jgi:hypothetical protein